MSKIPMHKTLAQTGKLGGSHRTGGKSTPQSFKNGGCAKSEKGKKLPPFMAKKRK